MAIKIAEDVPQQVAQFIRACSELKLLQAAHVEHLSKINKADSFPDSESILSKQELRFCAQHGRRMSKILPGTESPF
jgi:hypothetical protein